MPRLAAAREVLLRAARAPALVLRRSGALPRPVPRAPSHRAGTSAPAAQARRHAGLRCVERDGAGRSAGTTRARRAAAVGGGSPGEGAAADARRRAAAGGAAPANERAVPPAFTAVGPPAAGTCQDARGAGRRRVIRRSANTRTGKHSVASRGSTDRPTDRLTD